MLVYKTIMAKYRSSFVQVITCLRVQFGVFEKFTSAYVFQIAQEKSCDYLLIIYMKKFRDGLAEETHAYHAVREKLRHQLRHPGRALDLKAKKLIGHL